MMQGALVLPPITDGMTLAVRHPQSADANHLELRVDDIAGPAGRGRVVSGQREVQRKLFEQRVARLLWPRR
jgi:hypothetical protein